MANVAAPLMFKRVSRVDEVMRTKGWNLAIVDALAEELGVDRVTVYRLRNRAIQWTRRAIRPENVEEWRAQQVQALADTALEARQNGDYSAAAKCYDIQAKIVGTIAPTKVDVSGHVSVAHRAELAATPLDALLEDAARLQAAIPVGEGAELLPAKRPE